jgi:sulfite exporter TauE/SafE
MTLVDLTIPLGLGLVSSLHCTQMCGPIVLAYSVPLRSTLQSGILAHCTYNLGRILTYALLGAAAGVAGSGMGFLGRLAGIERGATIAAGIAMVLTGVIMAGWIPSRIFAGIGAIIPAFLTRTAGGLLKSATAGSKFILGLLLGLLPCGMVYAALLKAVETGSPAMGALSMAAFGLGTAGALLAIGFFSAFIPAGIARYANLLAASSILLLGGYLLWHGLRFVPLAGGCCHGS